MADPFEALRQPPSWAEPDPAFRARLLAEVDRVLGTAALLSDPAHGTAGPTHVGSGFPGPEDKEITVMDALAEPTDRGHRGRRRLMLLAAAAAAVALVVTITVTSRRDSTVRTDATADSAADPRAGVAPAIVLPEPLPLDGVAVAAGRADGAPGLLGLGGGQVWVVLDGKVQRFDATQLTAVDTITTPAVGGLQSGRPVPGFGSMWLPTTGGLLRFDLASGAQTATITVPGGSVDRTAQFLSDVAISDDGVWTLSQGEQPALVRIDPATNDIADTFPIGDAPRSVGYGNGSLWVTHAGQDRFAVTRHDPASGQEQARTPLGFEPGVIQVGASGVWVNGQATPDGPGPRAWMVAHLDQTDASLLAEIAVTAAQTRTFYFEFTDLALTADAAWVTTPDGLVRIDAATNTVTERYDRPNTGGITADGQHVWISDRDARTIEQLPAS